MKELIAVIDEMLIRAAKITEELKCPTFVDVRKDASAYEVRFLLFMSVNNKLAAIPVAVNEGADHTLRINEAEMVVRQFIADHRKAKAA